MPTCDCRRWLTDAIESVMAQTWEPLDLYVVDDASGDVDQDLLSRFPRVTFLRVKNRLGPYGIDNLLLGLTASEFVAFHDADDRSAPARISTQVAFLAARDVAGCGSWCCLTDLNGDPIGYETTPVNASRALKEGWPTAIFHPSSTYRRSLFERLIGFDSSTRVSADWELCLRACLSFDLGNVQRLLYRRRVRPGSLTQDAATGLGSPTRVAYVEPVMEAFERILQGEREPPRRGIALNDRPIGQPTRADIEWVRIGSENCTFRAC